MNKKTIFWSILLFAGAGIVVFTTSNLFLGRGSPVLAPNVLVITVDTTRADHIGCYGNDQIQTPNINGLAKEGILFEEAFSVQPVTLPSHCNIFTGQYPFHHGVRDNNIYRLADENLTLAEVLSARGYLTTAFISSYILDRQFGLAQGFHYYNDRFIRPKQKGNLPVDRRASEISFLACEWLDTMEASLKTNPFFLWLHYYDPHADYNPPHPYKTAYADPYDGEIAYMDDWLGFLFDGLKKRGLWENTIIVLVADHGESLGEYGERTHSIFIYRLTTHVPLIIRYPGLKTHGVRIKERAPTVDIMPTILDLLDLEVEEKLDGVSLVSLAKARHKPSEREIYSEVFIPRGFNWSELKGVRKGGDFFIEAPRPEFYHIGQAGQAQGNLIDQEPDAAHELRSRLLSMLAGGDASRVEHVAINDEMVAKLKALGYFVGGGNTPVGDDPGTSLPDPKDKIGLFNSYQRANSLISRDALDAGAGPSLKKSSKKTLTTPGSAWNWETFSPGSANLRMRKGI